MAGLDVTDDLYDEDFIDDFVVVPATISVDAYGLAHALRAGVKASGSVQAATGHDLMQLPEGDQVGGIIKIFTLYPLTTGDAHLGADRIVWGGALYTVMNVQSYRNYAGGNGHVEALARLASINPDRLAQGGSSGVLG